MFDDTITITVSGHELPARRQESASGSEQYVVWPRSAKGKPNSNGFRVKPLGNELPDSLSVETDDGIVTVETVTDDDDGVSAEHDVVINGRAMRARFRAAIEDDNVWRMRAAIVNRPGRRKSSNIVELEDL